MRVKGKCELQREVACTATAVVIRFGGDLKGEEVSLASLEGMFIFGEMMQRRNQSHVTVTLKGILRG